ncbi:MAG: TusA-related sulfurtransferase [Alphaproteobacteria bacterium]|jgi:TusA-related sulfurtransferase
MTRKTPLKTSQKITQQIALAEAEQKKRAIRYQELQTMCDHLLAQMAQQNVLDLDFDDPKALSNLDSMLKMRIRLLEFEKQVQEERIALSKSAFYETHQNRQKTIEEIIQKIQQATD